MGDDNANLKRCVELNLKGTIYIRDALSFYLTDVRTKHNQYNICIIIVSLFTALFESLKSQLGWDDDEHRLRQFSALFPIFLATFTGFISTMLKFERLAEKVEETTKAIEKCHNCIHRHREVLQCLLSNQSVKTELLNEISMGFREAILSAEIVWLARMDPITKNYYLLRSSNLHDKFLLSDDEANDELLSLIRESFVPIKSSGLMPVIRKTVCCCIPNICNSDPCPKKSHRQMPRIKAPTDSSDSENSFKSAEDKEDLHTDDSNSISIQIDSDQNLSQI